MPLDFKSWSLSSLQRYFKSVISRASAQLWFCFFIDGLDEYDGSHEQIADDFTELSSSPFVKLVIACRLLLVLDDAFKDCPGLRLQDLTNSDIRHYVQDKLSNHDRMTILMRQSAQGAESLVEAICKKSPWRFLMGLTSRQIVVKRPQPEGRHFRFEEKTGCCATRFGGLVQPSVEFNRYHL
jgi:hypothetical protein